MENVLGEIGKGHHIAFNILNVGRFKLGAICVGGCKTALEHAVRYAKQRNAVQQAVHATSAWSAQARRHDGP